MSKSKTIDFHFSGVFHVYPSDEKDKRYIEELFFTVHDTRFPSQYLQGIDASQELDEGCFIEQFLELEDIEKNKEKEFYFEIKGSGYIDYSTFETYYGTEHDVEYTLEDDYKIHYIDKETALELGGILDDDEVDEDVLKAVIEEENSKTERIFRD